MFPVRSENANELSEHNIRISELKHFPELMMASQPRNVIRLPHVRMISRGGRISSGGRMSSGIRITSMTSIKPPDPELVKKQEEEKLRAQVQKEIASRSKKCAHADYQCTIPVLTGRQYCYRHILQDPTAPFRQCTHTYGNGDRCPLPSPREPNDTKEHGLCFEHAWSSLHARQRSAAPAPPVTTTETLLHQLSHYVKPERPRTTSCASSVSVVSDPADHEVVAPQPVDPFKQIDAISVNASYSASILECASASESDCDSVILGPEGNCRGGPEDDLSDDESAPCEEQPLWRAEVYTAEEAVGEAKNVLVHLQSAYMKQMDRLKVLLQTARLQFLRGIKQEREQYCSINVQARSGPLSVRERKQLRKLKAYASHHKRLGVHAVLARKLHRKRMRANEPHSNRPTPAMGRCSFTEGGVRCSRHVLPAAKHCITHILHDTHQVLFTACGDCRGLCMCREPAARLPLPSHACRYHTDPPLYTSFTLNKNGSDSETESNISDYSQMDEPSEEVTETFVEPME